MAKRLTVLFLPHPSSKSMFKPWGDDVIKAIGDKHELRICDYDKDLATQFMGVEVVIDHGGSAGTREMADLAKDKVRLWQILGTGVDHFDLDYWRKKNIPVANTPGPFSAVALAECAMMFILMLTRKYSQTQLNLRKNVLYEPVGIELSGLKLGIIGLGASGKELARRALPFGLRILAVDTREVSSKEIEELKIEFCGTSSDIDRLASESDILSIHLPLNDQTRHLIDDRRLRLMKPSAFLINVARGSLVDEEALTKILVEKRISGAGLDVYGQEPLDLDHEIFKLPTVLTTPHIAGVTDGTSRKRAKAAADNIDRIAAGSDPLYRVD